MMLEGLFHFGGPKAGAPRRTSGVHHQPKGETNMANRKMVKGFVALLVCMWIVVGASGVAAAHGGHGKAEGEGGKSGILLVAFGSREASAQASFDNIQRKVAAVHPNIEVRWAYTSHIIREKLAGQGKMLDSPTMALARMHDDGFTHVVVQSLHTIAGAEYHDLMRIVNGFRAMAGFRKISLGTPLMATQEDMTRIVAALTGVVPKERKPNEAVVLMGHGTHHPANAFYAALMFQLQLHDANIFLGTVEGYPDLELIKAQMQAKRIKKAYLMPFMSVAGDHAKNDMAGDDPDSWKSILTKAGITCKPVMKGTAEYDAFADIWVDHIGAALKEF
jgi:sirohydrochlorin cobaltochelatase